MLNSSNVIGREGSTRKGGRRGGGGREVGGDGGGRVGGEGMGGEGRGKERPTGHQRKEKGTGNWRRHSLTKCSP